MPNPPEGNTTPSSESGVALLSTASRVNLVILCILLIIYSILAVTEFLTNIVSLLAASLILTYIFLTPVNQLDQLFQKPGIRKKHLSPSIARALAIVVVYMAFFSLITVSTVRIVPVLSLQIQEFARDIPNYLSQVQEKEKAPATAAPAGQEDSLAALVTQTLAEQQQAQSQPVLSASPHGNQPTTVTQKRQRSLTYTRAIQKLVASYKQHISKLGTFILDLGATTLSSLIYVLTTLVLVFYLLHDGKTLKTGIVDLMPSTTEASVDRFLRRLHTQFLSTIKGQVLMSFLAGGTMYLLLLALDMKYALLLGVFFGITSILPVIGPWIGLIPVISSLAFSSHPIDILLVMLITGLFYLTKSYWIWPKLVHPRHDIHPILFLLSFVVCLKLVGMMGILLSFPLASTIATINYTLKNKNQPPQKA